MSKNKREKHSKKSKKSKKRKSHKNARKSFTENDNQASTSNSNRHKEKSHKRKRSHSSSSDSSSCSSTASKTYKRSKKEDNKNAKKPMCDIQNEEETDMNVPLDLMGTSKVMRPQTREEWQQKQDQIKRVLDPDTGRYRLIKGDGEILEEIVSRTKHKEINKKATAFDGQYFESHTVKK